MQTDPIQEKLWQERHKIASQWQETITEFENHTHPNTTDQFIKLVEEIINILFADPFDEKQAQSIGRKLVQTHHAHPDLLVRTQNILSVTLVSSMTPVELGEIHSKLIRLYSQILAGYSVEAYQRVLIDQEKISQQVTTLQEQAQQLSSKQDSNWQTILDKIADPIILHDGKRIIQANPSIHHTLSYESPSLVGEPVLSLFAKWAHNNLLQILNSPTIVPYETAVSTQTGLTLSVNFYNLPLYFQRQDIYVLIIKELANRIPSTPPIQLTKREIQVLQLLAADNDDDTIAKALNITPRTVRFHLQNTFKKLTVSSRAAAIHKAWQYNLLD